MSGKWQKQKSMAGKKKISGSTRRKETNVGKVKPNDQNLQKIEKKDPQTGMRTRGVRNSYRLFLLAVLSKTDF